MPTCPHCGNNNQAAIHSNGGTLARETDALGNVWLSGDLSYLCTAPVTPGNESFDDLPADDPAVGTCGMQWDAVDYSSSGQPR